MEPHHSKIAGYLLTALVMVFTMFGMPLWSARAGVPAPVSFLSNPLSASITTITRVSVSSSGEQGNNNSSGPFNSVDYPSISADGRYVAFSSMASNLVSDDTNGTMDVFLRDTQTGTTTRLSVDSNGTQGNIFAFSPSISADGRYVAFESEASLVSGGTNGSSDIFLRDTLMSTTTRVSVNSSGVEGDNGSDNPSISADGRYVAFVSYATNLVSEDTNGYPDIFLRDTQTGTTTRLSLDSSGAQGNKGSYSPSISADGHFVAFWSDANNLVAEDMNGSRDIFLRNIQTSTTTRLSVDSSGVQGNNDSYSPSISADGHYVAYYSYASNLVSGDMNGAADIFLRDTQTGTTTRLSVDSNGAQANYDSYSLSISADGQYVTFCSYANNLVSGDNNGAEDVFLRDTQLGTTMRLSMDSSGIQGNGYSYSPTISADGRYVSFASDASNLVSGDTNGKSDVFVVPTPTISLTYLPLMVR